MYSVPMLCYIVSVNLKLKKFFRLVMDKCVSTRAPPSLRGMLNLSCDVETTRCPAAGTDTGCGFGLDIASEGAAER